MPENATREVTSSRELPRRNAVPSRLSDMVPIPMGEITSNDEVYPPEMNGR